MIDRFDVPGAQQTPMRALLQKFDVFLQQGTKVGVPADPALREKLQSALTGSSSGRLKLALVGGCLEGKTSIAAAWVAQLEESGISVSHQESACGVKKYEVGESFILIDTPELFGSRERGDVDAHTFKDFTKNYVSEAHCVLYVMNPTNPIRSSQRNDLVWLFRTLDLLARTVFVVSRFDEVADVEDDEDYQYCLRIKHENVADRLDGMLDLNKQERAELSIVGVSANPFGLGLKHWLANNEQFKVLSHITSLQAATIAKIEKNGGSNALTDSMCGSIIRDILHKYLPITIENDERALQEVSKLESLCERLSVELSKANIEVERVVANLREFIIRYFSDLTLQVQGCSLETFVSFFEREIGDDGMVASTRLQNEFSRWTRPIALYIEKIKLGLNSDINQLNCTSKRLVKQCINSAVNGSLITNSIIFSHYHNAALNSTNGVDIKLGKALQFKPWGATKLAKGANGALVVVGVALEAWDSWQQYQREQEFQKAVFDMVEKFEEQRQELLSLIDSEQFKKELVNEIGHTAVVLKDCLNDWREHSQYIQAWRESAESIRHELDKLLLK